MKPDKKQFNTEKKPVNRTQKPLTTSWEPIERWYKGSVGEEGHYYHQHIVLPGVLKLLDLKENIPCKLLDLACGTGVLAKHLPKSCHYQGIDISPSLVKMGQTLDKNNDHHYLVADATKQLGVKETDFTHAAIVLAIQNMEQPEKAIQNASKHLIKGGKLVIAMNHPCFRIPRQSSWGEDQAQKIQYRRIDRYLNPLSIPIQAHPSKGEQSASTWSFHNPLSIFSKMLYETGFAIELIEEWVSDKVSTGAKAKMENRSRAEIPLFLAIRAIKIY